jgi:hypothetical protein
MYLGLSNCYCWLVLLQHSRHRLDGGLPQFFFVLTDKEVLDTQDGSPQIPANKAGYSANAIQHWLAETQHCDDNRNCHYY